MKTTRLFSAILCVAMLLTLLPMTATAADAITEVGTAAELRAALENDVGAHVKLTKDIPSPFTTQPTGTSASISARAAILST